MKTKENFLDIIKKNKRIIKVINCSELEKLLKKIDFIFSKVFK